MNKLTVFKMSQEVIDKMALLPIEETYRQRDEYMKDNPGLEQCVIDFTNAIVDCIKSKHANRRNSL